MLHANALFTTHVGQGSDRGLSPRLWSHVQGQAMSPDGNTNARFFFDDFQNHASFSPAISGTTTLPSATVPGPGGYGVYLDTTTTASTAAQLPSELDGVLRLLAGATDNHEAWITSGGGTGTMAVISDTAADAKKLIFEARVRLGQVADNESAIFVGLAEEGLNAANTKVDNTGVMADKDFIGFNTLQADGDSLVISYKKEGQTQQDVMTYGTALAASTWYKLGFIYDPSAPTAKRVKFYIDNVEQSSYVTGTNIAAATFPDGEELAILMGLKNGSAAQGELDIDWVALYQEGTQR